MILAFFGLDGRSLSSHLALLAACAGSPPFATVLRGVAEDDPNPAVLESIGGLVPIVEFALRRPTASFEIDRRLMEAVGRGGRLVLDLPGWALADPALASRGDVLRVAPIGPTGAGLSAVAKAARDAGSSGGASRAVRAPVAVTCGWSASDPMPAMGFPAFKLPPLPRSAFEAVAGGRPGAAAAAIGERLVAHMRAAFDGLAPEDEAIDGHAERLWRLASDLDRYASGHPPTPEELAECPVLEDWRPIHVGERALAGRAFGHPRISDGRVTLTSTLIRTDGRTFARTMTRLYRLGSPAEVSGHG